MTFDATVVPCHLIQDAGDLDRLADSLATAERVVMDTETPISGPRAGQLRVLSVAVRAAGVTASAPADESSRHEDRVKREQVFVVDARDVDPVLLAPILRGVTADAWNASFDARVLDLAVWKSDDTTDGITWWDAQLADALLHQGQNGFNWYHGLAWATKRYLGVELEGKGTVQLSYDADSDLSADQVTYAASDSVYTMWVGDRLRAEVTAAGLDQVCEIEQAARPFLDQMQRSGLPFDWPGWRGELDRLETSRSEVLTSLAMMTGGGQGSLFEPTVEPSWNPGSDQQVRAALNQWSKPEVGAWTTINFGQARPLTQFDSVTASVLKEIGGELADGLLEFRNLTKTLSTYGESIHEHLHDDGRLRPQYLQVVGTNTGRLASRNPNAQNLTPKMKPYIRPHEADRVFVYADLSQAELRFLAQVADDEALRGAFARGVDVHVSTAATMFGFDPETLKRQEPDRFKHLRQIAKALNFGIAYGSGARSLARSLSAEGTPTSRDEADKLLDQYRKTYPGTAAWARQRIAEIDEIARTVSVIDWDQSLRLARGFTTVNQIRRELRAERGFWPDAEEIADIHPDRLSLDRQTLIAEITWLIGYSAPVALVGNGRPFTFASRTVAGRRQQFNLHLDRLFLVAVLDAVNTPGADLARVRQTFERDHGLQLSAESVSYPAAGASTNAAAADDAARRLSRQFDDRSLRRLYLEVLMAEAGPERTRQFLLRAARERVSAMVNAWRNAPIQGGVADIMLVAYADLHHRLARYRHAVPVQTVHDSITVECFVDEAEAVVREVTEALEQASRQLCPDVVPKADVDIRRSLADADQIATE